MMMNKMLKINEKEKYRHYKGGIYYKLAKAIIVDNFIEHNIGFKIIEEATFEATCEPMLVLSINDKIAVCFKDRESTADEYVEDVVLYVHENDDKIWVRFTKVFNETLGDVKRFTKID